MSERDGTGAATLVATGCGTAIASVCAIGLFEIERLLGGLWSAAAVGVAALLCAALASSLRRLSSVLPSGAGLLAYAGRGFTRRSGAAIVLPYLLMTLFMVGAESTIVGRSLAIVTPLPAPAGALLFLLATYGVCRAGLRIGHGTQALATWALIAGLALTSALLLAQAAAAGTLWPRLLSAPPSPVRFVAAVGQALFLFMGFELLTSQTEVAPAKRVGAAILTCVALLCGVYTLLALAFSCLPDPAGVVVPQLALAQQVGGRPASLLIVLLTLLASFTSFSGALLLLSRLLQALALQGVLPRHLADRPGLVPRRILFLLLLISMVATAIIGFLDLIQPAILAAAVSATGVYAAMTWLRERAPFAEQGRSLARSLGSGALALGFLGVGAGVIVDAGSARPALWLFLLMAYGAGALLARRLRG